MLIVLLDGVRIGHIHQASSGRLRFAYLDTWRHDPGAYPLSLSMPLTAAEHRHDVITSFLWGLLPDNDRTLDRYGRLFGVSPRNPVALLAHIGADCAGAVQFASPEMAEALEGLPPNHGTIEWIDAEQIARELRTVRLQGVPGTTRETVGQFTLAGAQSKIALLEEAGRWGRPSGRIPTNRILKPPSGDFSGFAVNEHFCLVIAGELELGAARSRVATFGDEVAIVVERFDRMRRDSSQGASYVRIHQEDMCQALEVMPTRKYETEGGPGIADVIELVREVSGKPAEDVDRLVGATALNWIAAATDAHAKNYSLLHSPRSVRLAPLYDILSYLPYAEPGLRRVKLAMRIGSEYEVRRISRRHWHALAKRVRMNEARLVERVMSVIESVPSATDRAVASSMQRGLDEAFIMPLRDRILERCAQCTVLMRASG